MLSSSSESDSDDEDDLDDGDGLPFACLACRRPWKAEMKPVVTNCLHYFCEKCARDSYAKSVKCVQCGADTSGIFNVAEKIIEKIKNRESSLRGKEKSIEGEGAVDEAKNEDIGSSAEDGENAFSPVANKDACDTPNESDSSPEDGRE